MGDRIQSKIGIIHEHGSLVDPFLVAIRVIRSFVLVGDEDVHAGFSLFRIFELQLAGWEFLVV